MIESGPDVESVGRDARGAGPEEAARAAPTPWASRPRGEAVRGERTHWSRRFCGLCALRPPRPNEPDSVKTQRDPLAEGEA